MTRFMTAFRTYAFVGLIAFSFNLHGQEELPPVDFIPDNTYAEIADRIACMQTEIPLHFNERVRAFVDYFSIRNRAYTRDILQRKELFFPIFSEVLKEQGLPDELKYLSIVESGLRPNAISRANAVGLWQFISSTGKMYGLRHSWYVDERMDPYEATEAACRHLKDLYRMFDSWELALAAYNCGPGNVRKAIRRSGYKREFWEIYRYLPRETRSYVPQFVAITYLLNHLEEHNLSQEPEFFNPEWDTIMVSQYFHIETFSNQLNLCVEDILKLNPQIKRGALPEGTRNFALKIPSDVKEEVVAKRAMLYDTASKVGKAHLKYLARNTPGSTYGRKKLTYRVRSGDVLGTIARRYHVRVSDIKAWNNIRGTMIRIGQRLNIWVLPDYNSQTKNLYTVDLPKAVKEEKFERIDGQKVYYVRSGDSLWSISRDNNTTIEKLKSANRLGSNTIRPGQSLIIPN